MLKSCSDWQVSVHSGAAFSQLVLLVATNVDGFADVANKALLLGSCCVTVLSAVSARFEPYGDGRIAVIAGKEYELRLRQQHASMHARTSWASLRPQQPRKRRKHGFGSDSDEEDG